MNKIMCEISYFNKIRLLLLQAWIQTFYFLINFQVLNSISENRLQGFHAMSRFVDLLNVLEAETVNTNDSGNLVKSNTICRTNNRT